MATTPATITLPFRFDFWKPESIVEGQVNHPYFRLTSGHRNEIKEGRLWTIQGDLPPDDPGYVRYQSNPGADYGLHPQNIQRMMMRQKMGDVAFGAYTKINRYILSPFSERKASNGILLMLRADERGDYGYYIGPRVDGGWAIKKKRGDGNYETLASGKLFPGTYNRDTNPCLLPLNRWIGVRAGAKTLATGGVRITFWMDLDWTGVWKKVGEVTDTGKLLGEPYKAPGLPLHRTDFMDAQSDCFTLERI